MYQGSEVPKCGSKCIEPEVCLTHGCVLNGEGEDALRGTVDRSQVHVVCPEQPSECKSPVGPDSRCVDCGQTKEPVAE
jgi:hypothetical protein